MKQLDRLKRTCAICGKTFTDANIVPGEVLRPQITEQIHKTHPEWKTSDFICRNDLANFRMAFVQSLLESEKGEVSTLEQEVLLSLHKHELISENTDVEFEKEWTFGERLADKIATFGGSWTFLICFGVFLVIWVTLNSAVLLWRPVDPYPFILLNLILSCIAAIQAPIIMMSQNRQEAKDRLRSQHDYQVNLKSELEIRQLHEKVDHLLRHQWNRLVEIQEVQLELLSELSNKK